MVASQSVKLPAAVPFAHGPVGPLSRHGQHWSVRFWSGKYASQAASSGEHGRGVVSLEATAGMMAYKDRRTGRMVGRVVRIKEDMWVMYGSVGMVQVMSNRTESRYWKGVYQRGGNDGGNGEKRYFYGESLS